MQISSIIVRKNQDKAKMIGDFYSDRFRTFLEDISPKEWRMLFLSFSENPADFIIFIEKKYLIEHLEGKTSWQEYINKVFQKYQDKVHIIFRKKHKEIIIARISSK